MVRSFEYFSYEVSRQISLLGTVRHLPDHYISVVVTICLTENWSHIQQVVFIKYQGITLHSYVYGTEFLSFSYTFLEQKKYSIKLKHGTWFKKRSHVSSHRRHLNMEPYHSDVRLCTLQYIVQLMYYYKHHSISQLLVTRLV